LHQRNKGREGGAEIMKETKKRKRGRYTKKAGRVEVEGCTGKWRQLVRIK